MGSTSTLYPTNGAEYTLFFIAVLGGAIGFAAIQGVICGIVTNGDPEETLWRQDMDALNFMAADNKLPQELRWHVRAYFRRIKRLIRRNSGNALLARTLSDALRGDVRLLIAESVFNSVAWCVTCRYMAVHANVFNSVAWSCREACG